MQLGGAPDFSPDGLSTRSHAEYVEGDTLVDMIKEDLVAERIAIESDREMIAYLGRDDSTTRRMLEGILAMEEEARAEPPRKGPEIRTLVSADRPAPRPHRPLPRGAPGPAARG